MLSTGQKLWEEFWPTGIDAVQKSCINNDLKATDHDLRLQSCQEDRCNGRMCKEAHSQNSAKRHTNWDPDLEPFQQSLTLLCRRTNQIPRKLSRKHVFPVAKERGGSERSSTEGSGSIACGVTGIKPSLQNPTIPPSLTCLLHPLLHWPCDTWIICLSLTLTQSGWKVPGVWVLIHCHGRCLKQFPAH